MTDQGTAAALVLAAGAGTRMGGSKALLEFDGRPLVERAIDAALAGGCADVFVVLGADADEVCRRTDLHKARIIINEDWAQGMGSSLRAGLAALAAPPKAPPATAANANSEIDTDTDTTIDTALILLVDQPFVGAQAVHAVLGAWRSGARLAAASYTGRRGHPVLFGREHWTDVSRSAVGDSGARAFLAEHADQLILVPCDAVADARDLDTPADLAAAQR